MKEFVLLFPLSPLIFALFECATCQDLIKEYLVRIQDVRDETKEIVSEQKSAIANLTRVVE